MNENENVSKKSPLITLETLKTAIILLLVTGITVILLAVVNYVTKGPIAELEKKELDNTIGEMFPNAEYVKVGDAELSAPTSELYAITENGEVTGFCVIAVPKGFGGDVKMLVGVDVDENVVGVKILADSETATKVAPVKDAEYLKNQYASKKAPFSFTKDGGNVDAVTSSTVSSKAVLDGVNSACGNVNSYIRKKGDK